MQIQGESKRAEGGWKGSSHFLLSTCCGLGTLSPCEILTAALWEEKLLYCHIDEELEHWRAEFLSKGLNPCHIQLLLVGGTEAALGCTAS